ncbi:hypothetical protein K525DRAFT_275783 [Schizophyllum commune Loenen D]|nr:hypothetical protein K525DRAFT_275783 [Schizophyllum commune Loenen D]
MVNDPMAGSSGAEAKRGLACRSSGHVPRLGKSRPHLPRSLSSSTSTSLPRRRTHPHHRPLPPSSPSWLLPMRAPAPVPSPTPASTPTLHTPPMPPPPILPR